jgi:hypothetical protein
VVISTPDHWHALSYPMLLRQACGRLQKRVAAIAEVSPERCIHHRAGSSDRQPAAILSAFRTPDLSSADRQLASKWVCQATPQETMSR